ncbi:MAG: hypothetical protein KDJ88_22310 [Bauldia sp.]|nr:hypothetical protein [Bauldia sp.]
MSSTEAVLDDLAAARTPEAPAVTAELERLLASPGLEASDRRRAFLRYIVEETLAGRADRLKGYSIAIAVFDRDEDFDAQADPVVRLEARRLRRDLDSYYMGVGSRDPVRISIPKGSYVPRFEVHDAGHGVPQDDRHEPSEVPAPPAPADATAETTSPGQPVRPAGRVSALAFLLAVAVLLIVVLAGALAWMAFSSDAARVEGGVAEPSLVVLPFRSSGPVENGDYLAEGIGQQLVGDLLRFPGFRVYTLPATVGTSPEALRLARDAGVSYVVSGSVSGAGEMVRVGAQVKDAGTGRVIWSATYDRPVAPEALIETQDEIAGEIATVVGQPYGVVGADLEDRAHTSQVASMQSYVCVLRAYSYRRTFDRARFNEVLPCIEETVQRDPGYGDAWAMLAWLHLDAARFGYTGHEDAALEYQDALDAANHAMRIEANNPIAVQAAAAINHYMGRFDEGERLARLAVALNPYDPDALAQLGWRLAVRGKFDEGIPLLEQAISRTLNPPGWYFHLIAVHLYLEGRYQEMLDVAERSGVDGSGMSQAFVAIAAGAIGDAERARTALKALEGPGYAAWGTGEMFRRHGATEEIGAALVRGLERARIVAAGS